MAKKIFKTRGAKTEYASDVTDEGWAFCAPHLRLMREDAPQRDYTLRAHFNGVRHLVRAGCPWRMIPNDLPPWYAVHPQAQRWIKAGCFETLAHDPRKLLRLLAEKPAAPRRPTAEGAASSNWRRPNAALSSCPNAGWWNVPWPGPADSDAWLAIPKGCLLRSPLFIGSPFSLSRLTLCSVKVHDTL